MPKPQTKNTKPVIKTASVAPAPAASTKRTRDAVFVRLTASKLHDLIGDAEIGVGRKELKAILNKSAANDVLTKAGLQ